MGFLAGAFPTIESSPKNGVFILQSNVVFFYKPLNLTIEVHRGFEFDLASIPKFFRSLVQKTDRRTWGPAAVHDYLYRRHGKVNKRNTLSRRDCDNVFYAALRATGVSKVKAAMMYLAVRIGGRF